MKESEKRHATNNDSKCKISIKMWNLFIGVFTSLFFVLSCVSASFAFRSNIYLEAMAHCFDLAKTRSEHDYSSITFQSNQFKFDEELTLQEVESVIAQANLLGLEASFSLISPKINELTVDCGQIIGVDDISFSGLDNIETGVANPASFGNENAEDDRFAIYPIGKMFKTWEDTRWSGHPFEGKDASSFISQETANQIIKNCEKQGLNLTYQDLLGMKMQYYFQGNSYLFSINNIYLSEGYFGPLTNALFSNPILTDCDRLYEACDNLTVSTTVYGTFLDCREALAVSALDALNGHEYKAYFFNENQSSDFISYINNDSLTLTINSFALDNHVISFKGTSVTFFVVYILSLVLFFLVSIIGGYFNPFFRGKYLLVASALISIVFMIISGIGFNLLNNWYYGFTIYNFVYGITGVFSPFVFYLLFMLGLFIRRKTPNDAVSVTKK